MATNIVKLPTAAPRKVRQGAHAVRTMQQELPQFTGEYKSPTRRALDARFGPGAKPDFPAAARTPELAIALSIYQAMPDDQKRAALKAIAPVAARCQVGHDAFNMMQAMLVRQGDDYHS